MKNIIPQIERAVGVMEAMEVAGIKPNVHTYTIIMGGYAATGDIGTAFEYFKKIKEAGLTVDVFVYEMLLKACCKSGRMQSALAVTREMSTRGMPRNTYVYNILIDGYSIILLCSTCTLLLQYVIFIFLTV